MTTSDKWAFDARVKRYRNTDTGRYVAKSTIAKMRDDFADTARVNVGGLASKLADQSLTVQAWESAMRVAVKEAIGAQYVYGRGGVNAMQAADWGRAGAMTREAYGYLRAFAESIAAGDLTEKQIAARSALYLNSTVNAYERGRAASFGLTLPVYPADGGTSCMSNCRCRWDITETSTEYRATWTLNTSAEHCDDCEARATKYSPYTVKKG